MQPITPPVGGGRIRLMGLYSGMDEQTKVTYVGSYDWRGASFRQLRVSDNLTEIDVPLSEEHFVAHDLLSARVGKTCIDSAFPLQGQLSEALIQRAKKEAVAADIVIFSHPWLFPFVAPVLDAKRQLIVYDSQNCEGLLKEKLLDDGSEAAAEVSRAVIRSEWELCHAADVILACSEADRDSFVRLYGVMPDRILSVPNGVFTEKILPVSDAEKRRIREKLGFTRPTLCFLGSNYTPNVEAAKLVADAAVQLPDCDFYLLGGVGESLRGSDWESRPNVTVTGFLEESEKLDFLHACDLALNPMLSGSGTNIKMFDFMAAGLPILTTEIGARGIDNTNGTVYALCACSTEGLVSGIRRLLADKAVLCSLAEGGRREAEDRYSWEKLSKSLSETLRKLLQRKRTASKKVLMVSTYPPESCGIGAYACQQVAYLRESGYQVDVLAIRGNGTYTMPLNTPEQILKLKEFKNRYDRIIIQYHASFFYGSDDPAERIRTHRAFAEVFADNQNIEIVCHEIRFPSEDKRLFNPASRELAEDQKYKLLKWKAAPHIIFHTQIERSKFCRITGIPEDSEKLTLIAPNRYYTKNRDIPREQARAELGIPPEQTVFLCIGFIQPHKAFDKVAEAFASLPEPGNRHLYMVGSLRLVCPETQQYLDTLRRYDEENGNIHLISSYVSDAQFDTWLIAADRVVIPYREIWSSGVLGRAKLFQKTCIVRDVGGLREQLSDSDVLFREYKELPDILRSV